MTQVTRTRVSYRRAIACTSALALVATGTFAMATAANATPASAPSTVPIAPAAQPVDIAKFEDGRYIVVLRDDAVATYDGSIANLARTAPQDGEDLDLDSNAAEEYEQYLLEQQSEVAASVSAEPTASLTTALNAFVADLTVAQARDLASSPRVSSIVMDEMHQITASPAEEFLDLPALVASLGGAESAGEGIVVGVLDTGVAPENPFFAGEALGTAPGNDAYITGTNDAGDNLIAFNKSDGGTFTGVCQTATDAAYEDSFTAEDCNTKLIGARYFYDGWLASGAPIGTQEQIPGEYVSPRDGDGHGSHTASTAAGNADVPIASPGGEDLGTMSGVASAARIASYKVCWSGPDVTITEDDGCTTSDLVNGINAAVEDNVDVINFSIGGGAATSVATLIDRAFLAAASAGIFVSASAGNSGPGATTLDHAAPWYTTVAATTVPNYEGTITLADDTLIPGATVTVSEDVTGTFVWAGNHPADGVTPANARLCLPGSIDISAVTAEHDSVVVLCDRGENARAEKSEVVEAAGGAASVLVNVTPGSLDLDDHAVPTIHADAQYSDALHAAANSGDQTVTLSKGNSSGIVTPAPVVAGFSSRGPVEADGSDVIKPDIAAPGVAIIAARANGPVGSNQAEPGFAFLSGTSMAAPHIAGIAALYLGERPNATPAEIKSAMMTTAVNTVDGAGNASSDVWAQGAGFVQPTSMFDPGLLYLNDREDWNGYLRGLSYPLPDTPEWAGDAMDPSDLNIASIGIGELTTAQTVTRTVTATATGAGTYNASVQAPPGISAEVSPTSLVLGAGESAEYTIRFERTDAVPNAWATGSITWSSDDHNVRSPIAIRPLLVDAPRWQTSDQATAEIPMNLRVGIEGQIDLSTVGFAAFDTLVSENSPAGTEERGNFTVAAGETTRYITTTGPDTADLDMVVARVENGQVAQVWERATSAANESLLLEDPTPGDYIVVATVYSTGSATDGVAAASDASPAADTIDWTVETVGVSPDTNEGNFSVSPASVSPGAGNNFDMTVSWQNLTADQRYLGYVLFESGGAMSRSYFDVLPAAETPQPTETPVPTAPTPSAPAPTADPAPSEGGGTLPSTGADIGAIWLVLAMLALAAGAVLVGVSRRNAKLQ